MNKNTFVWILECALLSFDNVSEEKMINEYGISSKFAKLGSKLGSYIKLKEFV